LREIFAKDFRRPHDSNREEKLLSSSDFVTAARVVQRLSSEFVLRAALMFANHFLPAENAAP